jgi:hypothetical protein
MLCPFFSSNYSIVYRVVHHLLRTLTMLPAASICWGPLSQELLEYSYLPLITRHIELDYY